MPQKNIPAMFSTNALLHHPSKMCAEQMPGFEGKIGENPVNFLNKFEYANLFSLTDKDKLRCISLCLKSTAYFWWGINKTATHNYDEFRNKFLLNFWNKNVQGNLRGKQSEEHFSDMNERSRHLEPPVTDKEFIAITLRPLPFKYQAHRAGRHDVCLATFREDLLAFDTIEKLQRQHNSKDGQFSSNPGRTSPTHPGNTGRNFHGQPRYDRNPVVNTFQTLPYLQDNRYQINSTQSYRGGKYFYRSSYGKRGRFNGRRKPYDDTNRNGEVNDNYTSLNQGEHEKDNTRNDCAEQTGQMPAQGMQSPRRWDMTFRRGNTTPRPPHSPRRREQGYSGETSKGYFNRQSLR
ncbi:hypothetical protein PR048_021400 [Dryococelus australis]|uniref:Retrotransposon gag domain-containing protein n=1 Tax=Dryococelus australis TaxID=614101 RepID=A0ABQ9GY53_9NEOP|nr:hypothetical protein PR048_021400 [Dryococelus australis]